MSEKIEPNSMAYNRAHPLPEGAARKNALFTMQGESMEKPAVTVAELPAKWRLSVANPFTNAVAVSNVNQCASELEAALKAQEYADAAKIGRDCAGLIIERDALKKERDELRAWAQGLENLK